MEQTACNCGPNDSNSNQYFETVKIAKTKNICPMCEDFAKDKADNQTPIAILSCEGACLRGEVSRRVANLICFSLMPEQTARICLGGAFTKDGGQRNLVRNASRVIALEGCYINCASRMMSGVVEGLAPEVIIVDKLYSFDKKLFGINEVREEEFVEFSKTAAAKIVQMISNK